MYRARATPLAAPLHRGLEPRQPQHAAHRDPFAKHPEVYAGHGVTSSPANREEEPVLSGMTVRAEVRRTETRKMVAGSFLGGRSPSGHVLRPARSIVVEDRAEAAVLGEQRIAA